MGKNNFYKILQKGAMGAGTIYVVVIMMAVVAFSTVLTNGVNPPIAQPTGNAVTPVLPDLDAGKKNLQLYTFGFTTPAPTPTPAPPLPTTPPNVECTQSDGLNPVSCGTPCLDYEAVACNEKPCNDPGKEYGFYGDTFNCAYVSWRTSGNPDMGPPLDIEPYKSQHEAYLKKLNDPNCMGACYGKPVIYLYPEINTLVDVKLVIPGKVVESDPLYPEEGWKNVLAHPDGSLTYRGKPYKELYYESQVGDINAPLYGVVIPTGSLRTKLTEYTTQLGLKPSEQNEFLDYWLPRLYKLKSPYVLFSLIDPIEKERTDHLDITPEPDTRIEFLAYFKPLQSPETNLNPLVLPSKQPERIGFTSVEWGGTIAY